MPFLHMMSGRFSNDTTASGNAQMIYLLTNVVLHGDNVRDIDKSGDTKQH